MKAYIWFCSMQQAPVERIKELVDKAYGQNVMYVREGEEGSIAPGKFGTPIGAGPEAPPGNQGVAMVETLRLALLAGQHPNLTSSERNEMLAAYNAAEELEQDWPAAIEV